LKRSSIQIAIAAWGVAIAVVLLGPLLGDLLMDARPPQHGAITEEDLRKLNWNYGPGTFSIDSSNAVVRAGDSQVFVQGQSAREFMRLNTGNSNSRPDAVAYTFEGPSKSSAVLYTYYDVGHVKMDDWQTPINQDALLFDIKKLAVEDNKRRARGYSDIVVDEWIQTPATDPQIPAAYWAYKYHSGRGQQYVTAGAIMLSRNGYSAIQWIGSPQQFRGVRQTLDPAIEAYRLPEGQRYADYKPGTDKVAKAGLGEIIVDLLTGSSSSE